MFDNITKSPSLWRSIVWSIPAETCAYVIFSSNHVVSHCPSSFLPQAATLPSLRRRTLWVPPAETWVYLIPSSKGASHSSAITSEEHGMSAACWSLGVSHSSLQLWNVALSRRILSTSHSATVTPDEHGMTKTCRNNWKRPRLTRVKTALRFEPNGLIVHLASNWTQNCGSGPCPEERKKREEGREAPEPHPEPGGTSKSLLHDMTTDRS